ncbi:MAG: phosphoglycerate dehydrogenase [Bacteroidia bacterium]|nr:phosphoglycerate dehydrogenase [Bacteroidia bacterium]
MKILIIDRFPQNFLNSLAEKEVEVNYFPNRARTEILTLLPEYDILIMNSRIQLDKEAIDLAKKLKLVVRAGVGMDHIDVDYLNEKGVRVENTKGGNANAVGEHTVGMLLAMRNKLVRANDEVKQFRWEREKNRGWEIGGKTIGIIGYGHTGRSVAKKLSGFGSELLAYDKYLSDYGDEYVEESSLHAIQEKADILSIHIPLSPETREWVNLAFFSSFKKPIYFLNLARGPIVKIADLLQAMDQGLVLAAALDVLPNEKLDRLSDEEKLLYEDLFARENVMLSPHIGGWTRESLENINQMILNFVDETLDLG